MGSNVLLSHAGSSLSTCKGSIATSGSRCALGSHSERLIPEDLALSILLGIALGLILLRILTWYPGEPYDYIPESEKLQKEKKAKLEAEKRDATLRCSDEGQAVPPTQEAELSRMVANLPRDRMKALLGIDDQKLSQIIEQAKKDAREGVATDDKGARMARWLDTAVYVLLFGALLWFTSKEASGFLTSLFPTEARTLAVGLERMNALLPPPWKF